MTGMEVFSEIALLLLVSAAVGALFLRLKQPLIVAFIATGILVLQVTHAVTYGTFHMASILYIDALGPAETKTTAQAANNAVTYGLGLMVGFFISGALYEVIGSTGLFAVSGIIALSGGLIFSFLVRNLNTRPQLQ